MQGTNNISYFPPAYTSAVSKKLIPFSYAVVINSSAILEHDEIIKYKIFIGELPRYITG